MTYLFTPSGLPWMTNPPPELIPLGILRSEIDRRYYLQDGQMYDYKPFGEYEVVAPTVKQMRLL